VTAGPVNVTISQPPILAADSLLAMAGVPLTVPLDILLANDTDPEGASPSVVYVDAVTAASGSTTVEGASLRYQPPVSPPVEDSFRYRVSDGTCVRESEVRLRFVAAPIPPANELDIRPSPPGADGFLLPFNAPAAGIYALERAPSGSLTPESFVELYRVAVAGPGPIAFLDVAPPASGASYRIRCASCP
jgi:hypothetical protein